jgi:FkbM family methyltransferase
VFAAKHNDAGSICLFGLPFYYHSGAAFYYTYNEIFNGRIYEFKPDNDSPVIIDCGSNMGLSVLFFLRIYKNATVIAFEPDEQIFGYLQRNVESQGLNNVSLNNQAVWIEDTSLEFSCSGGMGGHLEKSSNNGTSVTVDAVDLNRFIRTPVDLLKIDIEGAEFDVLKSCRENLINVKNIFVEYHSDIKGEQHLDDILLMLKECGFRYHLKESFSQNRPFVDRRLVCDKFDMAINVFAYRDSGNS